MKNEEIIPIKLKSTDLQEGEILKPIPIIEEINWGREGYFMSNYGRVWSEKNGGGKWLSPWPDSGYLRLGLSSRDRDRPLKKYGHQLVALTYLPEPGVGQTEVHHKDHEPLNNHIGNLQWVTPEENIKYATKAGKIKKIASGQFYQVVQHLLVNNKAPKAWIAKQVGISPTTVSYIKQGVGSRREDYQRVLDGKMTETIELEDGTEKEVKIEDSVILYVEKCK